MEEVGLDLFLHGGGSLGKAVETVHKAVDVGHVENELVLGAGARGGEEGGVILTNEGLLVHAQKSEDEEGGGARAVTSHGAMEVHGVVVGIGKGGNGLTNHLVVGLGEDVIIPLHGDDPAVHLLAEGSRARSAQIQLCLQTQLIQHEVLGLRRAIVEIGRAVDHVLLDPLAVGGVVAADIAEVGHAVDGKEAGVDSGGEGVDLGGIRTVGDLPEILTADLQIVHGHAALGGGQNNGIRQISVLGDLDGVGLAPRSLIRPGQLGGSGQAVLTPLEGVLPAFDIIHGSVPQGVDMGGGHGYGGIAVEGGQELDAAVKFCECEVQNVGCHSVALKGVDRGQGLPVDDVGGESFGGHGGVGQHLDLYRRGIDAFAQHGGMYLQRGIVEEYR